MTYKIRQVQLSDAEQILKVYTPFITDTCISFEYTVPTLEEFTKRVERIRLGKRPGKLVANEFIYHYKEEHLNPTYEYLYTAKNLNDLTNKLEDFLVKNNIQEYTVNFTDEIK